MVNIQNLTYQVAHPGGNPSHYTAPQSLFRVFSSPVEKFHQKSSIYDISNTFSIVWANLARALFLLVNCMKFGYF